MPGNQMDDAGLPYSNHPHLTECLRQEFPVQLTQFLVHVGIYFWGHYDQQPVC